jgi:hypothetical protein
MTDLFRKVLNGVSARGGYCLDCLSARQAVWSVDHRQPPQRFPCRRCDVPCRDSQTEGISKVSSLSNKTGLLLR